VIPPQANSEFVARMEAILDLYQQAHDPAYPLVCFDEGGKQLLMQRQQAYPARPGRPARYDYAYLRMGVCNLFMCFDPLGGQRDVLCFRQRTSREWAYWVRHLVDDLYPHAIRIRLVLDNLNTHTLAALYTHFPPDEAHRLAAKLELHFTPKHGSWLNMAEIELSVLARQCLDRRMDSLDLVQAEVAAWQSARNAAAATIDWRFTTADARIRLKHLYPIFHL
jgi:hypothetical protein